MKAWWKSTSWLGRLVALTFLGGTAFLFSESVARLPARPDRAAALIVFALSILVTGLSASVRLSSPGVENPFEHPLVERAAFIAAGAGIVWLVLFFFGNYHPVGGL